MRDTSKNTLRVLFFISIVICAGLPSGRSEEIVTKNGCVHAELDKRGERQLAATILSNPDLPEVLQDAKVLVRAGLNAGDDYQQVWIRDLNTFIELALELPGSASIRKSLLVFLYFQGNDGNIADYFIQTGKAESITNQAAVDSKQHFDVGKNTVETDQESSLVQAVYKYVNKTGDRSLLYETVNGELVLQRLSLALDYVLRERFDEQHGLVWGATTCDWGDVQPEHVWGVKFDENSHRAIDIYDNAMLVIAANNLAEMLGPESMLGKQWQERAARIKGNIRKFLWDGKLHKFRPHIYIEDSPFPEDFDEHRIYYHGGTSVAIEAGLLSREEISLVLRDMINNKRFAGAASIGLTLYPPYPKGFFKNPGMVPFSYQNGGDWTWFGARMVQQLILHGYIAEAYTEILPMVDRAKTNKGFFEWYTIQNQPQGSGSYKGSAGVLGKAVQMLREWAVEHRK